MFRNLSKDMSIINKVLDNERKDSKMVVQSLIQRYKLSSAQDPRATIEKLLSSIEVGEFLAITEVIVYNEDAHLNAIAFDADRSHHRFFTVNEIISFTENIAQLDCFIHIKENISIDRLTKFLDEAHKERIVEMFNSLPPLVKQELEVSMRDGKAVSFSPNVGIFIFKKCQPLD